MASVALGSCWTSGRDFFLCKGVGAATGCKRPKRTCIGNDLGSFRLANNKKTRRDRSIYNPPGPRAFWGYEHQVPQRGACLSTTRRPASPAELARTWAPHPHPRTPLGTTWRPISLPVRDGTIAWHSFNRRNTIITSENASETHGSGYIRTARTPRPLPAARYAFRPLRRRPDVAAASEAPKNPQPPVVSLTHNSPIFRIRHAGLVRIPVEIVFGIPRIASVGVTCRLGRNWIIIAVLVGQRRAKNYFRAAESFYPEEKRCFCTPISCRSICARCRSFAPLYFYVLRHHNDYTMIIYILSINTDYDR